MQGFVCKLNANDKLCSLKHTEIVSLIKDFVVEIAILGQLILVKF